jgi:hypothetical protein
VTDSPEPCPRCAPLVAELEARLAFRPCGYAAPEAALCQVTMPDGRVCRGVLCLPHQVLVGHRPAFALTLLAGPGPAAPCGWLVPAEEAMSGDGEAPAEAGLEEAIP